MCDTVAAPELEILQKTILKVQAKTPFGLRQQLM